jgi:hypothetical protein
MSSAPIPLDEALELTRTGNLWVFRGRKMADRAIQVTTNSPVNHVGMSVVNEDLPPLVASEHRSQSSRLRPALIMRSANATEPRWSSDPMWTYLHSPYMYHRRIQRHEDKDMLGQFFVVRRDTEGSFSRTLTMAGDQHG